ncbi:MAG: rhodanese-like domain-containing protein [Gemmatimonadota bacterium]
MAELRRRPGPEAVLAVAAIGLGVLAPLAGPRGGPGRPGVAELARDLAGGTPLVDAVTLAEWIRDRRPVRVLDVRDSSAFTRFSVPTASNVELPELRGLAVEPERTLVVYDDDGAGDASRSWLLLRRLGHPDVRVLERGVPGWIDGVVSPVLPADSPEERERYERVARVSRYFGGMPRIGRPPERTRSTADDAVQLLSRRGCY